MTNDKKAKLLDKVRKLLALSTSPNEAEAASAAAKAHALLAEHNLSLAEVDEPGDPEIVVDDTLKTDSSPWRRPLGGAVAKLYFCSYGYVNIYTRGTLVNNTHTFVGEAHNVIVAKLMFEYLLKAVTRLANEAARDIPKARKAYFLTSFKIACSIRLCGRIHEMIESAKRGGATTGTGGTLPALVSMYEQAELKMNAFLDALGFTDNVSRTTIRDAAGRDAGDKAGASIGLNTQVAGKAGAFLLR